MKKLLLFSILIFAYLSNAQTYKTITIVPQQTITLHSGLRSIGGSVSRTAIKVTLPANTVEWYYSFTTTKGESGISALNLAAQVGAFATSGPLGAAVAKSINVPSGSGEADVWLMTPESKEAFDSKNDNLVRYFPDLSLLSRNHAVKPITERLKGTYYLGLRNPSSAVGISITIEVVAVVKEDNPEEDKAKLYGSMGWKAYERGELDKCVELSNKALRFNPNLGWVKFNIALVHLVQENNQCLDEYIDAITTCKKDANPKATLKGALDDINNVKKNKGLLNNMTDIESLINNELSKY